VKTIARFIVILAALVTLSGPVKADAPTTPAVTYVPSPFQALPPGSTLPEVKVTVFQATDGFQMEWDSAVAEHGEEWCATPTCVNETLAKIGAEWTYSVEWVRV